MADIVELESADAGPFRAHRLRALETDPGAFPGSSTRYQDELLSLTGQFLGRLKDSSEDILLGAKIDTLVGTLGLARESEPKLSHKATLWGLYVIPERRRLGIGKLLVTELLEHVDRRMPDLRQIHAWVTVGETQPRKLLEQYGFRVLCVEPRALRVNGAYLDRAHLLLERAVPEP